MLHDSLLCTRPYLAVCACPHEAKLSWRRDFDVSIGKNRSWWKGSKDIQRRWQDAIWGGALRKSPTEETFTGKTVCKQTPGPKGYGPGSQEEFMDEKRH